MTRILLKEANVSLASKPHAVATWRIPGFYMDQEGHLEAKRKMEPDAQAAFSTALAYKYTGKTVYANKAREMIYAWAKMNRGFTENDGPLVSAYLGVGLIRAADMIKDYHFFNREEQTTFKRWMTQVCLPAWKGIQGRNNWWSWSLYAQAAYYAYAGDKAALQVVIEELKEHIDKSISSQGFITEETERGKNGMWYHYFALAPTTAAADLIRKATQEDLFHWVSPSGRSLKLALDTLFYYVNGHVNEWPYAPDQNFPELAQDTWPVELYDAMARIYGDAAYEHFVGPYRPVIGNRNQESGYYLSYAWVYPEMIIDIN
ncbi:MULTISPECIES: alginate lyase family protein [Paenibacillus]|nr:alginate lyase family protein [Paenibacillus rhizosphaerae]